MEMKYEDIVTVVKLCFLKKEFTNFKIIAYYYLFNKIIIHEEPHIKIIKILLFIFSRL